MSLDRIAQCLSQTKWCFVVVIRKCVDEPLSIWCFMTLVCFNGLPYCSVYNKSTSQPDLFDVVLNIVSSATDFWFAIYGFLLPCFAFEWSAYHLSCGCYCCWMLLSSSLSCIFHQFSIGSINIVINIILIIIITIMINVIIIIVVYFNIVILLCIRSIPPPLSLISLSTSQF